MAAALFSTDLPFGNLTHDTASLPAFSQGESCTSVTIYSADRVVLYRYCYYCYS